MKHLLTALFLIMFGLAVPAAAQAQTADDLVGLWSYTVPVPGGKEVGQSRFSADGQMLQDSRVTMTIGQFDLDARYKATGTWVLRGDTLTMTITGVEGEPIRIQNHQIPLEDIVPIGESIDATLTWQDRNTIDYGTMGFDGRMQRVQEAP
ncbi:MAG: hypothetical protein Alpg2KO_08830 [Alphaproteobacteria bacterium]